MQPRRVFRLALLLFLGAMVWWLAVRSRPVAAPPPNSTAVPSPTSQAAAPTRSPVAAADGSPKLSAENSPSPVASPVAPTPAATQAATIPPADFPAAVAPPSTSSGDTRSASASVNAIRVRRMVTDYHTLTGENPVGTNAEIMAAIMGNNPRQAVLGPPEGFELNAKGELMDEWGTPYFFHQLSRDSMEIHSAGPDKIMGTADDVVVR